jgi:hypothetical protein
MEISDYADLYTLQDKVFAAVYEEPLGFYLTGGTALSRFYLDHRYSDDLDFFMHDIGLFPDAFRLILVKLRERWPDVSLQVDARDFKRLKILAGGTSLKLDFVADRVQRVGLPKLFGIVYVDTIRNILSNKLCAIMGRDEPRDIADLIWIARKCSFVWSGVLADAEVKEQFQLEDLLFRLDTFPVETLGSVPFKRVEPIALYRGLLAQLRADLTSLGENTVSETGSEGL